MVAGSVRIMVNYVKSKQLSKTLNEWRKACAVTNRGITPNLTRRMSILNKIYGGCIFTVKSADNNQARLSWSTVQSLEGEFGPASGGLFSKQKQTLANRGGETSWGISAGQLLRIIVRNIIASDSEDGVISFTMVAVGRPEAKLIDLDITIAECEDLLGAPFTSFMMNKVKSIVSNKPARDFEEYVKQLDKVRAKRPDKKNIRKLELGYGAW